MTASTNSAIHLKDPGDLLAAVPHLLGFHPIDSLVLITHRGSDRTDIGTAVRIDLPPPEHRRKVADYVLDPVLQSSSTGVTVVVVGAGPGDPPADPPETLPERDLVEMLWQVFRGAGLPVLHSLWVSRTSAGEPWWCYLDASCHGEIPDPDSSALAAANAALGMVTYRSREDLAALLAPDDPETMRRRANVLRRGSSDGGGESASSSNMIDHLRATVAAWRAGHAELTDESIVRLAEELRDHRVRDAFLMPDSPEHAEGAERLWIALTRAIPGPECAEAACLLAVSAYLRGDGALAAVALERAVAAAPEHRLTALLRRVQQAGLPPDWLARALTHSVAAARKSVTVPEQ